MIFDVRLLAVKFRTYSPKLTLFLLSFQVSFIGQSLMDTIMANFNKNFGVGKD